MRRLLITGASGLLGLNLAFVAAGAGKAPGFEVTGLVHSHFLNGVPFEVRAVDLSRFDALAGVLEEIRPEILINCAALTNLDAIEADPGPAQRLNAELPGYLAKECHQRGIRFVHISTDAVFDGLRGGYTEEDTPVPPNAYARTKLAGEHAVMTESSEAIVARVNFFGWSISGQRSLAEWFLNNLLAGRPVKGFNDIIFCPLLANQLAELLLQMIEKPLCGLFHVVSRDSLSKYEFGLALARQFHLNKELIQPASYQEATMLARRSPNMTLRTEKLAKALGKSLPDVASGIQRFYELYQEGYLQRIRSFLSDSSIRSL